MSILSFHETKQTCKNKSKLASACHNKTIEIYMLYDLYFVSLTNRYCLCKLVKDLFLKIELFSVLIDW